MHLGFIHIIDKVLNIPSNLDIIITEAQLNGLAQVLSAVPPDPRLLLRVESDWILYVNGYLSIVSVECLLF